MNIAILHYHLKPGGVTNVIKTQLAALSGECNVLLVTGELPASLIHDNTTLIPELGYQSRSDKISDPKCIAEDLSRKLFAAFGSQCDILHVHNPLLAKNRFFLDILRCMQEKGYRLFLQIHDFAEDGRPLSYYGNQPYITNCHYGVINSRDYHLLLQSGLISDGLHLLPNAVNPIHVPEDIPGDPSRILYPVRAIRRKNIGEAVLLSIFIQDKTLSITLPPNSHSDIQSYISWKDFVQRHRLTVEFESGLHHPFDALISSSEYFITTSITEGFGFSFLESWTADKMIWGRSLPDICKDFTKKGVQLTHLYNCLDVPIEWIGKTACMDKLMSSFSDSAKKFNLSVNKDKVQDQFSAKLNSGVIDFGCLDEFFQKQIISAVLTSEKNKARLMQLNPTLLQLPCSRNQSQMDKAQLISINKTAVLNNYNLHTYRANLMDIYKKVIRCPVKQHIQKDSLISFFLDPVRFSLLKWGDYAE